MSPFPRLLSLLAVLAVLIAACTPQPPVVDPPFVTLVTNQAAALVIGQPDFTSDSEADTKRLFDSSYGRPLVMNGLVYLPDYGADRVMGYLSVPTANGAAADFVLGRENFDDFDDTLPLSARRMSGPQSLATDGTKVLVVEYSSSRILVYNNAPTTTYAAADYVIGQLDFDAVFGACTATQFSAPEGMFVHEGKLLVADAGNNRVLIWNEIPLNATTPADIVIGQANFTTCSENDDQGIGSSGPNPTARTLDYPTEVWTDGNVLVIADGDNNRVLIWSTFPTTSFEPADLVIGQPDFVTDLEGANGSGLAYPQSVFGYGTQLFVADSDNNRVLVWNTMPTSNGQPADLVLGQPDFISVDPNGGSLTATATGLYYPSGVFVFDNNVLVSDNDNERYVIYEGAVAP